MTSRVTLLLLGSLALVAGCSDQDHPIAPQTAEPELRALLEAPFETEWADAVTRAGYPAPDTPDVAVANFLESFAAGHLDVYASMLQPEFRFVLQRETIEEFALERGALTVDEEIRIAYNMVLGLPGANGERLSDVVISRFEPMSEWQRVDATDPIFGRLERASFRDYDVAMSFPREGEREPWLVGGRVRLVVEAVPSTHPWQPPFYHRIAGVIDQTTDDSPTGNILWGSLKLNYR